MIHATIFKKEINNNLCSKLVFAMIYVKIIRLIKVLKDGSLYYTPNKKQLNPKNF